MSEMWIQMNMKSEIERLQKENENLRKTLTYIQTQALTRPSGDNLTLSVIERNASFALHPKAGVFREMVSKALKEK